MRSHRSRTSAPPQPTQSEFVMFARTMLPPGAESRRARDASPSLARTDSRLAGDSKTRDRRLCEQSDRKETAMTEFDSTLDPFVEAEIKEHHGALTRQVVAIGIIMCAMLMWLGLH
jgi:hypothetical protein